MTKHWNDELMELEARDNLWWEIDWSEKVREIKRLEKMLESKDKEIGSLRFDIAVLKAELNAARGGQNG